LVPDNKDESEEEEPIHDGRYNFTDGLGSRKANRMEDAGSTGSSSGSRRLPPPAPSSSSKKLRSLSALDARPGSLSRRTVCVGILLLCPFCFCLNLYVN